MDPVATDVLVIVNPASAGGATAKRWPGIRRLLDDSGLAYRAELTGGRGDATLIARRGIESGVRCVACVGGDGTLNEVVNGFFDIGGNAIANDTALAIIPSGTGGDFRKSLGLTTDPAQAIRWLVRRATKPVDVGKVEFGDSTHRFFINIADCGIGGEVVARVNRSKRKAGGLRGTVMFLWTSLAVLMTYPGCRVTVDVDGVVTTRRLRNVVIANGKFFGGGMKVAPEAAVDDGQFDVVLVGLTSKLGALTGIPRLYKGTHISRPEVETFRGRTIRVRTDDAAVLFDLEGEQIGQAPAVVSCLPSAIRVVWAD